MTSLIDPKSNVTTWTYDVQGRLTGKQYPDTSTVTYAYETTTSRLKSVTDATSQVKTYSYARDDRLLGIVYTGAVNSTPNVGFTWDPYFPRLASRTDGVGTTQFTYGPVGSLGALQVQQESGPFANSAITSAYDELGRLASRTVQGAGAETFQYDAIGRLTGHGSDLGAFTLGYLGQTGQITSRQLAGSTLATTWSYLGNTGDRRLSGINNVGLTSGHFSTFAYTTTPENFIDSITETSDATAVYPPAGSQTATYNNLNQLTDLSGQTLTWDAVGNLTSDGQRTYAWDAENRLVLITYPGQPGKQTAFTYDGLGRRRTITSTPPGGGSATTTAYLWCGDDICQARDGSNTPVRSYYDEGEYVPSSPAQTLYYGIDQIGSVRRVFASTTSASAYGYDPYGVPAIAAKQTRIGGKPTPNVERLPYFAEAVNRWHPTRKHRLLWIDHSEESFPSIRHLFIAARAGLGDTRSLSEAPGHYVEPFDYGERDQTRIEPLQARETGILVGLMSLLMAGGWDGWLVADDCHDRIEFWEGNVFFHSTEASRLRDAEALMNEFDCPTELV